MREAYQRFRTLADRLAFQVRDSVFGHHVHHISAWRCHHIRVIDARDDAARTLSASLIGRREAEKSFATARGVRATEELKLAAGRGRDESDVIELMRANPDQEESIRTHLAAVHPDYVLAFDRLVERAREQQDE